MVALARAACDAGQRVWWVGLPAQRAHVLRRVTAGGYTALGLEVMSGQQAYYRLLTAANRLQPMLVGSARLVRVAEALKEVTGAFPTPGEAHLFARAIAEAKRFGVGADGYAARATDPEQKRFAAVYRAYEARKGAWDYDDVRTEAVELARRGELRCEADLVIVDGLREIGPLELRLYRALAEQAEVHLSLTAAPPGETPTSRLTQAHPVTLERYLAPNPVSEARWVMRSLKRDLVTGGFHPLDLAVIAPEGRARALAALAEEYGVPLMDESPLALVDRPLGQRLVDLLELLEHPTPSRLLAVAELRPLAAAALEDGVAGVEAVTRLADALGLGRAWRRWLARLEVSGEPVAWARALVVEVLGGEGALPHDFAEGALAKAQEAARLGADGPGFRAWWAALLRDTRSARREPAGVALTTAQQASGRRFRKAYLLGAVDGAYAAHEEEDYFLPEEQRLPLAEAFARLGLPHRFQGRAQQVAAELLTRADHLVVTAPQAGQGGPLVADEALLGAAPAPLPPVPAGSRLELEGPAYRAPLGRVAFGRPTVERLRRYRRCPFRVWGESALGVRAEWEDDPPAWRRLLTDLTAERNGRLTPARLEALAAAHPEAAGWLEAHAPRLTCLTYNVEMFGGPGRAAALLHAAERVPLGADGQRAVLYRFVAPGSVVSVGDARAYLSDRWTEYYAAYGLLHQARHAVERVDVVVWPVLGEPVSAYGQGVARGFRLASQRRDWVNEELPRYLAGDVEARPGFHCRDCEVLDLCREGTP